MIRVVARDFGLLIIKNERQESLWSCTGDSMTFTDGHHGGLRMACNSSIYGEALQVYLLFLGQPFFPILERGECFHNLE